MEIRRVMPAEELAAEEVVSAAFGEPPDGRVVQMMRALQTSGAARASLVAVVDEELVGHVGLSRGWVDARRELVEVVVLSPLSVRPDLQRREQRGADAAGSAPPPPLGSTGPRRASRTRGSRWRFFRRTSRGWSAG